MSGDDFVDNVKRADAEARALERARTTVPRPRRATNTAQVSSYVAGALSRAAEAIENASERNNTANTELFNLGQLVGAGALDRKTAEDTVADACRRAGLSEREIRKLLRDDDNSGMNRGIGRPRDMRDIEDTGPTLTMITSPPPDPPTLDFAPYEDGFWNSRKSLQAIYLAALSRMCSPWSVLACCAARALATVRPHVVLPDIIGGAGSLNWFAAITAVSGGGKGAASATAKILVNQAVIQRNTGSGEGIIGAYKRPKTDTEPAGLHESVMFMVDEIDSLTAQTKRSGATTMSVLRSAFSGEMLGFSYVNTNTPVIEAHSYRMTMVVAVQPARATDLLADVGGGTPQRFMWFPGTDERISVDMAGGFVQPLVLPKPGSWQYPQTIRIPGAARDLILRERVKAVRGNRSALDGHALFVREKFAFALAVLDGRTAVSEEDWELSGIAAKVSDMTREWVAASVEESKDEEAAERGRLQGVSSVAADDEKSFRLEQKRAQISARIREHLKKRGPQGVSKREEQRTLGRDGKWAEMILDQLVEYGEARYDRDEKRWYIE